MTTPHDRDLERLLDDGGEFGALYRRLPRAEPPRRLDRSVIAAAARAVRGRAPRRQRWLVGVGSAAGLVLAAGIAWQVGQDALRQQRILEPARAQRVVPVQPITEPVPHKNERAMQPHAAPATSARQTARTVPPPAPAAASPTPFPAQSIQREETTVRPAQSSEPAPTAKSARADAPPNPAAAVERVQTAAPAAPSDHIERHRDAQPAPPDWLAHIRQLLRNGHRQQALESLRQFRRAHPEQALPDDLRALDN